MHFLKMAQEPVNTFIDVASSTDWICTNSQEDDWKNIFELWEKDSDTALPLIKCTGQVQCSAKEAFEYILISDLETRQQWDPQVAKYDLVQEIDVDTHLLHYVYSTPWPVTTRDFSVIRYLNRSSKGRYILCAKSIETEAIPVHPDFVRGEVFISGYIVEDVGKGSCTITTLNHVDPKGWIPMFMVNMAKSKQLTKLINLSRSLDRVSRSFDRVSRSFEVQK